MSEVRKVSRRHKTPRPRDRSSRRQERGHERLEAEADNKSAASSTRPPAGAEVETNETNGRRERDKWNIDPSNYTYFTACESNSVISFDEFFLLHFLLLTSISNIFGSISLVRFKRSHEK